jgi:hypothetical protein
MKIWGNLRTYTQKAAPRDQTNGAALFPFVTGLFAAQSYRHYGGRKEAVGKGADNRL